MASFADSGGGDDEGKLCRERLEQVHLQKV